MRRSARILALVAAALFAALATWQLVHASAASRDWERTVEQL